MKQETKQITLKELATLAFDLPVGGDIYFSCREDANFWAIQKRQILDGPLLIVGSYGGGSTYTLDTQIDNCLEATEEFLTRVLIDDAGDEVWVEALPDSISLQFRERLLDLKIEALKQIRELVDATEDDRWVFEDFATDPVTIQWMDIAGNRMETPLYALQESIHGLRVTVCCEEDLEDMELDDLEFGPIWQHEVNNITTDKWVEILTKMTK